MSIAVGMRVRFRDGTPATYTVTRLGDVEGVSFVAMVSGPSEFYALASALEECK